MQKGLIDLTMLSFDDARSYAMVAMVASEECKLGKRPEVVCVCVCAN